MNLDDIFALGRRHDPQAIALSWRSAPDRDVDARTWSYAELDLEVERVAAVLSGVGVVRGDRVALFCGNRPEWVFAFLAILRVGAVVVPINIAYRKHELAHIVADAEPRVLIIERAQQPVVDDLDTHGSISAVLDIDGAGWAQPGPPQGAREREMPLDGSALAMLLYTSGTTGRSKGAMISHDNFLATMAGLRAALEDFRALDAAGALAPESLFVIEHALSSPPALPSLAPVARYEYGDTAVVFATPVLSSPSTT